MKAFNKPERAAELGLKIIQAGEQSIIMKDIATLDENQSIDDFMNQLKREDIRLVESEPNSYNHIKNTLALAYMQYLDNIRYESKMCLSNGECMDIERAFEEQDWSKLLRYFVKYYHAPTNIVSSDDNNVKQ